MVLKVVVFTADPAISESTWWPVLLATPGLRAVLVVRKTWPQNPAAVWRRFRRNVAKHGLVFVPYRLAVLIGDTLRRLVASAPLHQAPTPGVPVEEITANRIHAPEVLRQVRAWQPDLGVSIGAPILKPELFSIPTRGTLNLHLGKLPIFRGAPPAFWELYTGADRIGATVHWVDAGLDTGAVLGCAEARIYAEDSRATVEARAVELGRLLLARVLSRLSAGDAGATPQRGSGRTFRAPTLIQRARLATRLGIRRLSRSLRPRAVMKLAAGLLALWIYRPLRDLWRTLVGRHPVRVFTFHRVTHLCRDGMTVSPEVFQRQMAYLRRYHDVVPMERAVELLALRRRLARPVAVVAFDDAYHSVRTAATAVLDRLGLVATCFVSTDLVGADARFAHDADNPVSHLLHVMTWNDLRELRARGWTVGGHGASHRRLSECVGETLRCEIVGPLDALRERLGLERPPMAYPFGGPGDLAEEGRAVACAAGYSACFSNFGGENLPGDDLFRLKRIDLGANHQTVAWKCWAHGIDVRRRSRYAPARVTDGA